MKPGTLDIAIGTAVLATGIILTTALIVTFIDNKNDVTVKDPYHASVGAWINDLTPNFSSDDGRIAAPFFQEYDDDYLYAPYSIYSVGAYEFQKREGVKITQRDAQHLDEKPSGLWRIEISGPAQPSRHFVIRNKELSCFEFGIDDLVEPENNCDNYSIFIREHPAVVGVETKSESLGLFNEDVLVKVTTWAVTDDLADMPCVTENIYDANNENHKASFVGKTAGDCAAKVYSLFEFVPSQSTQMEDELGEDQIDSRKVSEPESAEL